jgi:hypothetical protein
MKILKIGKENNMSYVTLEGYSDTTLEGFKMPSLKYKAPKIKLPTFKAPKMNFKAPKIKVPKMKLKAPKMNFKAPNLKLPNFSKIGNQIGKLAEQGADAYIQAQTGGMLGTGGLTGMGQGLLDTGLGLVGSASGMLGGLLGGQSPASTDALNQGYSDQPQEQEQIYEDDTYGQYTLDANNNPIFLDPSAQSAYDQASQGY